MLYTRPKLKFRLGTYRVNGVHEDLRRYKISDFRYFDQGRFLGESNRDLCHCELEKKKISPCYIESTKLIDSRGGR